MNTLPLTSNRPGRLGRAGRQLGLLAGLLATGWLVGCSTPVKLDETPVESRNPTAVSASGQAGAGAAGAGGAAAGAGGQGSVASVDLNRNAAGAGSGQAGAASMMGRVVYFDFDSFVVKDDYRALIENHAKALAANRSRRMVIEGHADERGGSEYNLALGQKRAEAVSKALVLLGANESQLEAVSFGKERPVAEGSDEAAMARNRRAELKDR